jgi:hypothetical protein
MIHPPLAISEYLGRWRLQRGYTIARVYYGQPGCRVRWCEGERVSPVAWAGSRPPRARPGNLMPILTRRCPFGPKAAARTGRGEAALALARQGAALLRGRTRPAARARRGDAIADMVQCECHTLWDRPTS